MLTIALTPYIFKPLLVSPNSATTSPHPFPGRAYLATANQAPAGRDLKHLNNELSSAHAKVATAPGDDEHFHRGAEYAASFLVYDRYELSRVFNGGD